MEDRVKCLETNNHTLVGEINDLRVKVDWEHRDQIRRLQNKVRDLEEKVEDLGNCEEDCAEKCEECEENRKKEEGFVINLALALLTPIATVALVRLLK